LILYFNDHDGCHAQRLKQIGYYDELFDPEEEGGGEAHKAIRRKKDTAKLSERYREALETVAGVLCPTRLDLTITSP
jgi:hypothetical protein